MSEDDIDHIPPIVATRDSDVRPVGVNTRSGDERRREGVTKSPAQSSGTGWLASLFIVVALTVAVGAGYMVWQLQQRLQASDERAAEYAVRIADLEARLSDTDEGMNQNAAVQAVRLKELETEVRKLWDNVWKKSKERLGKLEAASGGHGKAIASMDSDLEAVQSQLQSASGDIAELKSVAGDLSRLMASARSSQDEVERVADALNRINLDLAKLDKRVQANEEWVGSINAFRKQVNASLVELQDAVRAMQTAP